MRRRWYLAITVIGFSLVAFVLTWLYVFNTAEAVSRDFLRSYIGLDIDRVVALTGGPLHQVFKDNIDRMKEARKSHDLQTHLLNIQVGVVENINSNSAVIRGLVQQREEYTGEDGGKVSKIFEHDFHLLLIRTGFTWKVFNFEESSVREI